MSVFGDWRSTASIVIHSHFRNCCENHLCNVKMMHSFKTFFFLFSQLLVILQFLEELVLGKDADGKPGKIPSKPQNKKITFSYSDSSDSDDDSDRNEDSESAKDENKSDPPNKDDDAGNEKSEIPNPDKDNDASNENKTEAEPEVTETKGVENEAEEPPAKKQCVEGDVPKVVIPKKPEEKSVDRLIEEEIKQLGNKNTVSFQ